MPGSSLLDGVQPAEQRPWPPGQSTQEEGEASPASSHVWDGGRLLPHIPDRRGASAALSTQQLRGL